MLHIAIDFFTKTKILRIKLFEALSYIYSKLADERTRVIAKVISINNSYYNGSVNAKNIAN